MQLSPLTAISPIDGRYRNQLSNLAAFYSEYALIRYRLHVEVEYLIFLGEKKFFKIDAKAKTLLRNLVVTFSESDAEEIKQIERTTNHDVKAVEYFIKDRLEKNNLGNIKEWVHFGLTSQDVNNTAIPLLWKDAIEQEYLPAVLNLQHALHALAERWHGIPMLARTHGQPASPTILGKEFMVFVERLENQIQLFSYIPFSGKFGGATGNFNAHGVAYPKTDWVKFANQFLEERLGIERQQYTTQVEHYDTLAAHFDAIKRINTILIDLSRDIWTYISMDYFKQKTKKGEVGSSAMPHKVNPIDFENAEGNLGIANALLEHLSAKLPVSRLQRDLTDSTVLRNIGVPMGHTQLAILSIQKGLNKLILNEVKLKEDLEDNWAVVAEAIQTILRRENYPNPYEVLKELTRGNQAISRSVIHGFINSLKVPAAVKQEMKKISPSNYTGKPRKL
ncbi:MAG: adenylosuccinate lyase [Chitinophagaceae bacterium]|nr:MAG: adenylosuccinate lyase [Chitinophagaceae bacterium]